MSWKEQRKEYYNNWKLDIGELERKKRKREDWEEELKKEDKERDKRER